MCTVGLAEAITLKCNAEREKYLTVYDVIEIINSDDIDLVIHIMDSSGLFSLTVYELNNLDPYNPIYKPVCNSYELKQKVRDYIKARRQFIHEDNNFDENMTLQRCLKKSLWSRFDLLKIEDIVKNTRLIVRGDSNAIYSMYSDMINRRDNEYYELPESTQQAIKDYMNLGSHQRELMNLASYSPEQIICLMTNDDPARINRDEKHRTYWDIIKAAFESNKLTPLDDSQDVESKQVQRWLKHNGLLYQKSDSNSLEEPMKVYDMRKRIDELEKEAADAKATGSFSMETPILTQGDPKKLEQLSLELITANTKIADLESKLVQANAALADASAEAGTPQGIAKHNANKAYIISTSQELAKYIWGMDTKKAIRTGDMVQQIRHVMHNVAPKLLPDDKAIRDWLSGIAPDYAKKAGKPSKDAPNVISLTMKK